MDPAMRSGVFLVPTSFSLRVKRRYRIGNRRQRIKYCRALRMQDSTI